MLFLAAVGSFFAALGVWAAARLRRFRRTAVQVPGVVTALRAHSSSSGDSGVSVIYRPVLRFTTMDGRIVETESSFGSNPPPARQGARVPVLYDPANPSDARLTGVRGSGVLVCVAFIAVGGLVALIGVVGLLA